MENDCLLQCRKGAFLFAVINCKIIAFKQINSIFFLQVKKKSWNILKVILGFAALIIIRKCTQKMSSFSKLINQH